MIRVIKKEIELVKSLMVKREYVDTIELEKRIKEKRFTVKDIGVDYRWIDHWNAKGLLIGNYEPKKWRKFNLIEFVWLKIIIKMREFNLGLDTVKSVKDILDLDITGDEIMGISENSIMEIIPQIAPSNLESATRKLLGEKEIQKKIKQFSMKMIEIYIMDILSLYNYYSILINPNGEILPVKYSYLEVYSDLIEFKKLIKKSYVSISITEILKDFILEKDINLNNKNRIALLTEEESLVLTAIRQDGLKSVIVKFDDDNKLNLLEEVKEERFDKASRLFEMIMTKGYQDITIKTQNGQIVYCENKKKIMIQKKD
jgi:DNA-binding transcriptional MerR regulator